MQPEKSGILRLMILLVLVPLSRASPIPRQILERYSSTRVMVLKALSKRLKVRRSFARISSSRWNGHACRVHCLLGKLTQAESDFEGSRETQHSSNGQGDRCLRAKNGANRDSSGQFFDGAKEGNVASSCCRSRCESRRNPRGSKRIQCLNFCQQWRMLMRV